MRDVAESSHHRAEQGADPRGDTHRQGTPEQHTLGTAKLARPQGTFTLVWHIPPTVHGPLYVFVDDNCVVKGAQQAYESYYSFTAP